MQLRCDGVFGEDMDRSLRLIFWATLYTDYSNKGKKLVPLMSNEAVAYEQVHDTPRINRQETMKHLKEWSIDVVGAFNASFHRNMNTR